MAKGAIAVVLHAHLPYVRSAAPGSLEEDWFFQALLESYLPLLEMLEQTSADPTTSERLAQDLRPAHVSKAQANSTID